MDAFRNMMQSTSGRVFLGIVLVIFVIFGFGSQFQMSGSRGEVVDIDGEKIFPAELDNAVESVMARYADQFDRRTLSKLVDRHAVLESLIRQKVLLGSARDLGLVAHPAVVQESIFSMEAFHDESGKFSEARFRQAIASNGYDNAAAFRTRIEQELLSAQLTGALRDSAFATRQDLELLTRIGGQQRNLAWVALAPTAYLAEVNATEAEVQARYDANTAGYLSEEKFSLDYIEVDLNNFVQDQQVSESDVKAKYEELAKHSAENAERRVAHILIGGAAAEAQARAAEVIERLAAGESFAKLAGEFSADKASAKVGGDLGYVSRDVLDPALDQALFALQVNEVSAPVATPDGLHLLRLLDIRRVDVPPFEQAREGIAHGIKRDHAREEYLRVMDELGTLSYESDTLQEPASRLGLTVRSTPLFGRGGGTGIAANPKVMQEVLTDDVLEGGRNSAVIALGETQAVVVRIKEHRKPQRRAFAEVSAEVRQDLLLEKAALIAREKSTLIRDALTAGRPLDAVAGEYGVVAQYLPAAQRASQGVPPEIIKAAFRLKPLADGAPMIDVVETGNGTSAVVVVSSVIDGSLLTATAEEIAARRAELASAYGRFDFSRFIEAETAMADIERFRENDKKQGEAAPKTPLPSLPAL